MENLQIYRNTSIDWKPSAVVALATSPDGSQVAAAREDSSLEIWLVSPGSVGWHCQLTIQGECNSRVTSLIWCRKSMKGGDIGRLLSSNLDGSVSEWDLFSLKQKIIIETVGFSIWKMALEPLIDVIHNEKKHSELLINGHEDGFTDSHSKCVQSDDDDGNENNVDEINSLCSEKEYQRVAIACDDGCIRLYRISDSDGFSYRRSFPRVSGRTLSVEWSLDAIFLFSGSSDGLIRCWDSTSGIETYRITVDLGGLSSGSELCIWSLLFLRCGTIVSADSTGSVQFWESHHGTLLQKHSYHKGDANALAADPSHKRVFSAGSDGKVILYKASDETEGSGDDSFFRATNKWAYVGYSSSHTHDIRSLVVAVPIVIEAEDLPPDEKSLRKRQHAKPVDHSYHKWAHLGVPMLLSAGDDAKIFAYSATDFTKFNPHDICPAPQRVIVQLALNSVIMDGAPIIMVQFSDSLDILSVELGFGTTDISKGGHTTTPLLARIKAKRSRKIISSTISSSGMLFAYSDHVKPCLFELRRDRALKNKLIVSKRKLPRGLPYAHAMIFSSDSSLINISGQDRKIYVVNIEKEELLRVFIPCRNQDAITTSPSEPPITKMFTSFDGQWLAAINCFGDIYIFNLEIYRQHWFISRLDGASVTAGGFPPGNCNVLIIMTSSNQVYVFDVEAKELGDWSRHNAFTLPRKFQEFPGEVVGLSFPPSSSTSVIVYSSRAMCFIDFGMPIDQDDKHLLNGSNASIPHVSAKKIMLKKKRKNPEHSPMMCRLKNFDFFAFNDPVLFMNHVSEKSLFVIQKPWIEVVESFGLPVHKHIYGT